MEMSTTTTINPEITASQNLTSSQTISRAADYFRSHDLQSMRSDLDRTIRDYPVQTMVTAAALGFLLGALLRRL